MPRGVVLRPGRSGGQGREFGPRDWLAFEIVRIGIHPGGGHTWLLDRAAGPQTTAAMDLFGERVDGLRATAIGLAWECVDDGALLDRALALAGRAAEVPRELAMRTKATIR